MSERLPHEKGFHVSWDQLHRDARALAWRLDGKGPNNGGWKAVVAITRGGMAPAMIVARELDIRIVFQSAKTKIRKGSKTTYGMFCDKHGIMWAEKQIPESWLREKKSR